MPVNAQRRSQARAPSAPPSGEAADLGAARLAEMWRARRAGLGVACLACDHDALALSIAERRYQWSCVRCGWLSPWFGIAEGRLRVGPARRGAEPRKDPASTRDGWSVGDMPFKGRW